MTDTFGKENRATPTATLEQQILDPNTPKNGREWWAAAEITALRAEVAWHVEDKNKWEDTQAAHLREVTRLTAENFSLASWQCEFTDGKTGLVSSEGGSTYCAMAKRVEALRAEVEQLNKSRNKWGQKYNKLLERHKVTVSLLQAVVWSAGEKCKLQTAENERLRAVLEPLACTCDRPNGAACSRSEVDCPFWSARAALEKKR